MSNTALAMTAEEKGYEIGSIVDQRDMGWVDSVSDMRMTLTNQQGEKSIRSLRVQSMEDNIKGNGDKSLIVFEEPYDVKGTAFLSYSRTITPDEQWLYLPALKRVKRISSSNKSGPFMGSQFAYEDLTSFDVEKYNYKYLRNETMDNRETFVVDTYPKYKYSGYTHQVVWIDAERYIPLKIEYYDRKNSLLKTLKFDQYEKYMNKYWRAREQSMENHQNGKTTLLSWGEFKFKNEFDKKVFNRSNLKRIKY